MVSILCWRKKIGFFEKSEPIFFCFFDPEFVISVNQIDYLHLIWKNPTTPILSATADLAGKPMDNCLISCIGNFS